MFLNIKFTNITTVVILCHSWNPGFAEAHTPPNYNPSTSNTLNVTFNQNLAIIPGQSLAPNEAARSPTFFAKDLDPFEPYIAFMIDVEIVRNGLAYPLLHWYRPDLWVDIQSKDAILGNRTSAEASYVGPQPNIGPAHTYVLLLFRQPLNYKFPQCFQSILPLSEDARKGFDLHAFMEIAGLDDLVGANYFHSQNPDDGATTTSLSRPACAATMKLKNAATYSPRVDV